MITICEVDGNKIYCRTINADAASGELVIPGRPTADEVIAMANGTLAGRVIGHDDDGQEVTGSWDGVEVVFAD